MRSIDSVKRFAGVVLRIAVVVVMIAALVAGGRALILKKKRALAQAPKYKAAATRVDTAIVYLGDLPESHDYLAVVEPIQTANISARVTARIETVAVDEGDSVTQGQSLINLDHRQVNAQLAALEAQIKQVQADLQGNRSSVSSLEESLAYWSREAKRDSELAKNGTIPSTDSEATIEKENEAEGKLAAASQKSNAIEQQIQSLQAQHEELKTVLSYCEIQSPVDGTVTSRLIDPGDQATPGKTLITIESAGAMMIAFDVPQSDLPAVKPGLAVSFKIDGEIRNAAIARLYPSFNRARMMRAEVHISAEKAADLTSGQYLTATVVFQRRERVSLVPASALVEGVPNGMRVFVAKDGQLEVRKVHVLGTACELAAVEGVEEGERVVVHSFLGWARLSDGMKVEEQP